jgi:hypothetical protein
MNHLIEKCKQSTHQSDHARCRMQEVGRDKLWFTLDESSKVNNVKKRVTERSSAVSNGCCPVPFSVVLFENNVALFLN